MLYTQKVLAELERKRGLFTSYQERHGEQLAAYRAALRSLGARYPSAAAISAAQDASRPHSEGQPPPLGARPTAEYDRWRASSSHGGVPCLPFGHAFAHHEEARAWAESIRGVTTIAVDGSQLLPWKDASVPVALVQAGLFENPHTPPAPYVKDVAVELLGPDELAGVESDVMDSRSRDLLGYSEQEVHLRRFELEAATLVARMEHHAARSSGDDATVVAFYDGSLLVSFALKMPPHYRQRYAAAVQRLRAASEACRVPLLGYIDTSYARDIVTLLYTLSGTPPDPPLPSRGKGAGGLGSLSPQPSPRARGEGAGLPLPSQTERLAPLPLPAHGKGAGGLGLPDPRGVYDALLWDDLAWGDRSPAFLVARGDQAHLGGEDAESEIAFIYLRTATDRPPARIEFPRWLLDAGMLDRVMDVARAEIIAGTGYPYCIEAADAVAVISSIDRARFYALFQDYAEREGISFTFSRKAASKGRRRV